MATGGDRIQGTGDGKSVSRKALAAGSLSLALLTTGDADERELTAPSLAPPRDDPFALLAAAVRGTITTRASDLSSLENNMIVMEILEAAKTSARVGKTVEME